MRPFVARHCAACHDAQTREGDLVLTGYPNAQAALADRDLWEYAAERVRLGEMPPKDRPRPSPDAARAFVGWIEGELGADDEADPWADPWADPGRPVLRRLNNTQYRNAVRDLFGVDFPANEVFPTDAVGHGFDTVGAAQALPELSLEKYVEAAETIAARAIAVDDSLDPRVRELGAEALEAPFRRGAAVLSSHGDASGRVDLPRAGRYRLRAGVFAQQAGPELARAAIVVDGRALGEFEVSATPADGGQPLELEVPLEGGERRVGVRFLNDYYRPEAEDPSQRDRNLYVEWIEVTGPLDPPRQGSFQTALAERFAHLPEAEREGAILAYLVRRVWRRPASGAELARLAALPPDGAHPSERLRLQLTALLASPHFLFLVEADPPGLAPGSVRDLTGPELAARLALFLWSTVPDKDLDRLTDSGQLCEPEGLVRTVRLMLADPRSRALADGFATQWLQLTALAQCSPDRERFPTWDEDLRASMLEESRRVFDAVLREGRSAWELLDADWTFVNGPLAAHYGLEEAAHSGLEEEGGEEGDFRRVSLAHTPRRGVLGHAGVLTATSDPTRTSPVKRGKWVLSVLLNAPPPDPPPGADVLDDSPEARAAAPLRQRLEAHRARPECAVCHDRMDPLGFGLERYDAVGRWRVRDGEHPIDATGVLPDGRRFDGPAELVGVLRADERFPRALTEKLLVYALGRGLGRGDRRGARSILAGLDPEEPALFDIILEIVLCDAFTRRRVGTTR